MPRPLPKFIVIDEVSLQGRRAYGPYKSFRDAAKDAMIRPNAYVLPLEPPFSAEPDGSDLPFNPNE